MGFRFLLIAVSLSLVVVLASTVVILTFQRNQLVRSTEMETSHLSEVIEASLEYPLQTDNWALADRIVQNEGIGAAIEKIWVIDPQGTVRISTLAGDVGQRLDANHPTCQFCHTNGEKPESLTRIVNLEGQPVLLNVNMLRDQYACPTCSPGPRAFLGVLFIERPLTELNALLLAAFWRIVGIGGLTFLLLVALLLVTYRKLVLIPVQAINHSVSAISGGNLDVSVPVNRPDELGSLAEAFNHMRRQLKASQHAAEQRSREHAMINEVALATGELFDPQQIMELALDAVIHQLGMHAGMIFLYDQERARFTLQASRNIPAEMQAKIERQRLGEGPDISSYVVRTREVYFVPNMADEAIFLEVWGERQGRSYVNVPLISRGAAIGTLPLISHPGEPIQADRLELFKLMGHVIGIAIDNALLLASAQEQESDSRQLYELLTQISASLEMTEVMTAIARQVRVMLKVDLCLAGFVDENQEEVVFLGAAGNRPTALTRLRVALNPGWLRSVCAHPNALAVAELACAPALDALAQQLAAEGMMAVLLRPLYQSKRLVGCILVASVEPRHFLKKELTRLERVAQQVVVAIENALLYQKVRYLATVDERERLAREMHDNLAQALGYFNLQAAITETLLEDEQLGPAKNSLRELKQLSLETYTDVRETIFNLRTTLAAGLRFLPSLQSYLKEYRCHYGLEVQLSADGIDLARFSPEVDIQLLRIIQEALTNVRKHAEAVHVWIQFERVAAGAWIKIAIADDGQGFDPQAVKTAVQPSFGVQIMQERALSIGGSLELDSTPGGGTRVVILVPDPERVKERVS